jgi:hypothetical protein
MATLQVNLTKDSEQEIILQFYNKFNELVEARANQLVKPWVRQKELSKLLSVSIPTINLWKRQGLPCTIIEGVTLYNVQQVNEFLLSKQ